VASQTSEVGSSRVHGPKDNRRGGHERQHSAMWNGRCTGNQRKNAGFWEELMTNNDLAIQNLDDYTRSGANAGTHSVTDLTLSKDAVEVHTSRAQQA